MGEVKSFLRDLDEAVSRGTPESRARALWHTTDLMVAGRYSDDEIWTFGEVIGRLADEIEVTARAQLAKRLSRFEDAPVNILHKLAAGFGRQLGNGLFDFLKRFHIEKMLQWHETVNDFEAYPIS